MKSEPLHVLPFPPVTTRAESTASTAADRWILRRIQHHVSDARLRFRIWDGYSVASPAPVATIVIRTRRALLQLAWDVEAAFGDAYMSGAAEVEGDLVAALEEAYRAIPARPRPWWLPSRPTTFREAEANVHHHYDLGNDFYRLWLDRELVYTCAYFPTPDATLEAAQLAKMDLVCRKVYLRPGERVVEAGCGWGSLALYMAKHYGVTVRAFNVSREQIAFARDRAGAEGLGGRVEFVEDDYRNVSGRYDVFMSVGMLEHVGAADYDTLGRVIDRSLAADGRGLLHFIGRNRPSPLNAWIRRRIFPGAYPPTLVEVVDRVLSSADFSVLDVQNLRLHYARTLQHWLERFSASERTVAGMFDEAFVRAWRLYLAGAQASFTTGSMQLFQVVFARGATNAIPWSRAALLA